MYWIFGSISCKNIIFCDFWIHNQIMLEDDVSNF